MRTTAAPLAATAASSVGPAPVASLPLEPGSYVALVRLPGHEPQRVVFTRHYVGGQPMQVSAQLDAVGTAVPGFVRVEGTGVSAQDTEVPASVGVARRRSFWIMEREVTCAEYLAFLNDPATRAEIAASARPIRFPRDAQSAGTGGFWTRGADGRFALAENWRPEWPVLGVSYEDAEAYAAWRTETSDGLAFGLPTYAQWVTAGEGIADRNYPFGPFFWPRWVSSCFATPEPSPEPVLSYPVDESPFGVFDLSGSATEWCRGWWGSGEEARRLGGGSWAQARVDLFKITGGSGAAPDASTWETGFRLVVRRVSGRDE